jgi:hypothetical protein
MPLLIRAATAGNVPLILQLVRDLGKALLLHVARLANQRGCGRMERTVLDWNKPAQAFYQKLGSTVRPDWRICRLTGPALARYAQD